MRTPPRRPHRLPSSVGRPYALMLCAVLALALVPTASPAQAQTEGTWTASRSDAHVRINLRWGTSSTTLPVTLSEPRGLLEHEITSTTATPVAFRIEREAGAFEFEGAFEQGRGAGTFRFHPNPQFAATLRSLGIEDTDRIGEHELLALTVAGASAATVREFTTLGLGPLDARSVIELAIFGITPEYVQELRAAGVLSTNSASAIVQLRIAGITPTYVRELEALGYRDLPHQQLVEMGMLGVTPEFIREQRELGPRDLSPEALIRMRFFRGDRERRRAPLPGQ